MRFRVLSKALSLAALFVVMGAWAQDTPRVQSKDDPQIASAREETAIQEKLLSKQFKEFQEGVLKLTQRLDRSPRREDKERAAQLRKVLEMSQDASIAITFDRIGDFLKKDKLSLGDVNQAAKDTKKLADDLQKLIDLMQEDTQAIRAKKERDSLEALVKRLDQTIRELKQLQGRTDREQTEHKELKQQQDKLVKDTASLGKDLDNLGKDPKDIKADPSEAKNDKGSPKDGGKDGGKQGGESKDEGKVADSKKGESKDQGKGDPKAGKDAKPAEAKAGDPKGAKSGEPKDAPPSEAKSGKPGSDSKQADAKGSKNGKDAQGSPKDSKGGEAGKQSEAKDEGKEQPKEKAADAKGGVKTKNQDNDKKPAEAKTAKGNEDKQANAKDKGGKSPDGAKPSQAKDGGKDNPKSEAKSGDKSDGKASAKSQSQPGSPMPPQQAQPSAKGGDPQDSPPTPPQASNPKDAPIGKKQIQDSNEYQKQASKELDKKDNKQASNDQGNAIQKLQEAKKELEKRLQQLREDEIERILAALLQRCEKMLAMQVEVLNGTERVEKAIQNNAGKKVERENQIDSSRLSDEEKKIVVEATKAIEILEAEGTAVAFPEVFQQVREDMKHVQRRLDVTDTGIVTQAIERDIIASLTEMIDALKQKKKENDDKKNPPMPPMPGQQPPPQDQKLLDQIAELKMIRSMQVRVNERTQIYGRQYQGEQAFEPAIRREIRGLAERQERIFDITSRIAKGDNK